MRTLQTQQHIADSEAPCGAAAGSASKEHRHKTPRQEPEAEAGTSHDLSGSDTHAPKVLAPKAPAMDGDVATRTKTPIEVAASPAFQPDQALCSLTGFPAKHTAFSNWLSDQAHHSPIGFPTKRCAP